MTPPEIEPLTPQDPARSGLVAPAEGQIRLDFEREARPAREMLADCLEAVLVTGLEQIRRELVQRSDQEDPSQREDLLLWAQGLATESPERIRRALSLWSESTLHLLNAGTVRREGSARLGVDDLAGQMPRELPLSVRILGDELAHVLADRAVLLPALAPGSDPAWSLYLFSLSAVSTLEPEVDHRLLQPTLRSTVLDEWPELVRQAAALMLVPAPAPRRRRSDLEPPALGAVVGLKSLEHWPRHADAFAAEHGLAADSPELRQRLGQEPRQMLQQAGVDPVRLGSFDLVQAAFDWLAASGTIPPAAQPLVWRLQRPFTVLATLDPAYLSDEQRSLRRLLSALSDAARHAPDQLVPGGPLLERLETAVRAIEVMAQQVQTRARVLSEQFERELRRTAQGVGAVLGSLERERDQLQGAGGKANRRDLRQRPSPEREAAVTEAVNALMAEKIAAQALPESVRRFLETVWVRHLRTAILREGPQGAQFHAAVQAVDDLIWSLDTSGPAVSRAQLVRRIPTLVQTLAMGARSVGLSDEDIQPFLDELFLAHLRRMQRSSSAVFAERPAEVHSAVSAPRSPTSQASGIPLVRILRETPTDDCPPSARPTPLSADQVLEVLKAGDWIQLESGGTPSRLKVAWLNADRSVVLLIRDRDRKAVSLRGQDLQERFARKTAMLLV
jgi:hypothetical protein